MIKVENIDVWGFEHAVRGMRNPMNSWAKSDSGWGEYTNDLDSFDIGENDLDLMRRLYKAGSEHRKYLRQIMVSMDVVAPLYWWKEFDTYKVGTAANSCSTMHKIHAKAFTPDDFSVEYLDYDNGTMGVFNTILSKLNTLRDVYNVNHANKIGWYQMIQLLPSSYNQRRTITMNYENVISIIKQRTGHKLDEWNEFVEALKDLPYIVSLIGGENEQDGAEGTDQKI